MPQPSDESQRLDDVLAGHPHARAVLSAAAAPDGLPAHAYLFHGPAGAGKGAAALAFAAELLAGGARDPEDVRRRVFAHAHPDLTWVRPSGAATMLVSDIDEQVVAAAVRTPFESSRRVFVIEQAGLMGDEAANRLLKTLEEPARFVHIVLLASSDAAVLQTVRSRCIAVRFEPAATSEIAARLSAAHDLPPAVAAACAALASGDARMAAELASAEGEALRAGAEAYVRGAIHGQLGERPWLTLITVARERGVRAGDELRAHVAETAAAIGGKEAKRIEREGEADARRTERRARTRMIDLALLLTALWLRDLAVLLDGGGANGGGDGDGRALIRNLDRRSRLREDAESLAQRGAAPLRDAMVAVEEARISLALNPTEDLLLEALARRLGAGLAVS